jgi:predicted CoA-binding protein
MTTPREIIERSRTIASVGVSTDPRKAAHSVPASLQAAGYKLIPVNPNADTVLGEKSYRSLSDVTEPVDVVQVFRPAAEVPDIARAAVNIGAKALWLQPGIRSDEARDIAESAGLDFVEDRCMGVERARYNITPPPAR